ncbi:hypothetical protein AB0P15_28545 [Streptomyces sp. NPDC087917]|uniref:hypothetical protein n=1 Tax=Streptomyces sp. NPDC087917 TaxID=3155060 RepID=UPI003419B22C
MIVTNVRDTSRTVTGGVAHTATRSLARRGFFFSETEAVDHLRLSPDAEVGPRGRVGTEEIWFVAGGDGHLVARDGTRARLVPGALAVCGHNSDTRLRAGAGGLELVLVAVAPRHLTATMPPRLPVAS